jgi:hypothetical protein
MTPYKELLNYGIAVAILVPLMAFLLWAGRAVVMSLLKNIEAFFDGLREQLKEMAAAMKELSRSSTGMEGNCKACREASLSTMRTAEEGITRKFIEVTAASHDKLFASMKDGFSELASSFDASLTGAANSIRAGNESTLKQLENLRLQEDNAELKRQNEELSRPTATGDAIPRVVHR